MDASNPCFLEGRRSRRRIILPGGLFQPTFLLPTIQGGSITIQRFAPITRNPNRI